MSVRRGVALLAWGAVVLLMWGALFRSCHAQAETLLVQVQLTGVSSATVEATLDADSVLSLAAADVRTLLGVTVPAPRVTLPELARVYPSVSWRWLPARLVLLVDDPRAILPASQAAAAAQQRTAQAATAFAWRTVSGPFGGIAADDSGRTAWDAGYTWRGRVAITGRYLPAARRGEWTASLAPIPQLSVTLAGDHVPTQAAVRVAAGPAFAFMTYTAGAVALDGLVALGPLAVFASSRNIYVVTLTRAGVAVQAGLTPLNKTVRLSFGSQPVSPFFLSQVPH